MAAAVAQACGTRLHEMPSTALTARGIAEVLIGVAWGDVVFLDEAHVLKERVLMALNRAIDTLKVEPPVKSLARACAGAREVA
jgi:Holliday junction resolvasome RuvABC ATP-dependent DNA helicase subunit